MQVFSKFLNGFFNFCNKTIAFLVKYPFLVLSLALVLVGAIIVLLINNKANVGGILGKVLGLFGSSQDNIQKANSISKGRKQALEEVDKNGYVQHKISELESSSNPFRDKTVVKLPDGTKVKLPEGIKDTDVDSIIKIDTKITIVPTEALEKKLLETKEVVESATKANTSARDALAKFKAKYPTQNP